MPELCDVQNSPRQVVLQPINRELDTDATFASYLKQKEQLAEVCDCRAAAHQRSIDDREQ